jgi:hypothetical protein
MYDSILLSDHPYILFSSRGASTIPTNTLAFVENQLRNPREEDQSNMYQVPTLTKKLAKIGILISVIPPYGSIIFTAYVY